MPPTYSVYLSKSAADPETGTQGTDWVYFTCQFLQHPVKVGNPKKHLIGHKSFRVAVGKIIQSVTLTNVLFLHADGGTSSIYYDNFIKLALDSANVSGAKLYLWVYNPFLESQYLKWYDKNGTMQNYLQCEYKGSNFKFDAAQLAMKGSIMLEEVWD